MSRGQLGSLVDREPGLETRGPRLKSGPWHSPAARPWASWSTPVTQPPPLLCPGTKTQHCFQDRSQWSKQKVESIFPVKSPSTHVVKHLLSCVSTPSVLSLDVDSILSHRFLRNVLDHCIAARREVHYIRLCHSTSISVYEVLNLLLSLCINSWGTFQFVWNSTSSLFLLAP